MALHSERLLDHFQNPRNVGHLPSPALTVNVTNPACGDMMRLSARFHDGLVAEAKYEVRGCTASIAAGSILTVWLQSRSVGEIQHLEAKTIEAELGGLTASSKHASILCVDAAHALANLLHKNGPGSSASEPAPGQTS